MVLIVERDSVDRVEIIRIVEVHVDAMHHHDHFAVRRRASFFRVHNERAIESLGDMTREREYMTVIQMQAKRFRIKLVREAASRFDKASRTSSGNTVHLAG